MRDYLVFFVNGQPQRISAEKCFVSLANYLRYDLGITGTKVVCEEGDCGACSVLIGRLQEGEMSYRAVNACITFLYQLDCTHIVTVEGLKYDNRLNPVQEAMVACHGAQCGYCTPGFITTMCGMFERCLKPDAQKVKDELTGNLCRCTGYEPIVKAALEVKSDDMLRLGELYPDKQMLDAFAEHAKQPVLVETPAHVLAIPTDLNEAVKFKAEHQDTVIVAGGTDVCVYWNKRGWQPRHLLSLSHVEGLNDLRVANGRLTVGAKITLSQLEAWAEKGLPQLKNILWLFGSPQIRHTGTLAGNIANGSPIADSLPFLFVMEAQLDVIGSEGKRSININNFYTGYKQLALRADEIITGISIPLPENNENLRLYKVSKRKHLDISAFTAAFRFRLANGKFASISIAYGGVASTVLRMRKTEQFLLGKPFDLEVLSQAGEIAVGEIAPISDVRGSADFRKTLGHNMMLKLFHEFKSSTNEVVA